MRDGGAVCIRELTSALSCDRRDRRTSRDACELLVSGVSSAEMWCACPQRCDGVPMLLCGRAASVRRDVRKLCCGLLVVVLRDAKSC